MKDTAEPEAEPPGRRNRALADRLSRSFRPLPGFYRTCCDYTKVYVRSLGVGVWLKSSFQLLFVYPHRRLGTPELAHSLCPNGNIYGPNCSDRPGTAFSGSQTGRGPQLHREPAGSRLACSHSNGRERQRSVSKARGAVGTRGRAETLQKSYSGT